MLPQSQGHPLLADLASPQLSWAVEHHPPASPCLGLCKITQPCPIKSLAVHSPRSVQGPPEGSHQLRSKAQGFSVTLMPCPGGVQLRRCLAAREERLDFCVTSSASHPWEQSLEGQSGNTCSITTSTITTFSYLDFPCLPQEGDERTGFSFIPFFLLTLVKP